MPAKMAPAGFMVQYVMLAFAGRNCLGEIAATERKYIYLCHS
jgi:hypothetical protein